MDPSESVAGTVILYGVLLAAAFYLGWLIADWLGDE